MIEERSRALVRRRRGRESVTGVELFFDLVYVFAVTQLSHALLVRPDPVGVFETLLLFVMVWLAWIYTTWMTNFLDPERLPVRLALLALALVSLVLSSALPDAFAGRGLVVAIAYATMQIGRSLFAVLALPGNRLQANFERILFWCVMSGACVLAGGIEHGGPRVALWVAAVAIDLVGGAVGFATPGLGRSTTADWTIEGNHFAERCQAFLLIALGESVVVIGETMSGLHAFRGGAITAVAAAFVSGSALWWIYFDRVAEEGAKVVAASADPGRLGRSAYHFVHPIMVAGVIAVAAAEEGILEHATDRITTATAALLLGGTVCFLVGHVAFTTMLWRQLPWGRVAGIVALVVLAAVVFASGRFVAIGLSGLVALILVAVAGFGRRSGVTAVTPGNS